MKKVRSPSEKKPSLLCAIQTSSQDGSQDLDDHPDLVPSLSDEEIRIAQTCDPELCRFMELLHRHSVKPTSKLLTAEPPDVKILFFFFFRLASPSLLEFFVDI